MALEGIHHVTCITADAPRNLDFYVRVLGLRLIKKTVNFDQPDVYHLYYGDEEATPGAAMTFFEFPGAAPGRPGDGMVHTVVWRVASTEALDFWAERLLTLETNSAREGDVLRFADPEGLALELKVSEAPDAPLASEQADIPDGFALLGFDGLRAYSSAPSRSAPVLEALDFRHAGNDLWESRGQARGATLAFDVPPDQRGLQGAGTVHHVAWSAADDHELDQLRAAVSAAGLRPTPIIDRQYFHSVYFREPSGILFELASRDVGFDVDEPMDHLGEKLVLPPQHEHLRQHLEKSLTPLPKIAR